MRDGLSEVLTLLPGVDPRAAIVEKLGGGLTNRVYLVTTGDRRLVVRLATCSRDVVPPDRSCEVQIIRAAAASGLAPEVVHADEAAGLLVTQYIDGKPWREDDLRSARNLRTLAALLRRVHALPCCGRQADLEGMAGRYRRFIECRKGEHAFAADCESIVSANTQPAEIVCCHNDVVAANVIDGDGLKLVDWEYAADNDPLFDLASVIAYHDLDHKRQHVLLDAYNGGADAAIRDRLAGQLRVFDALQWLWLAVRELAAPAPGQAVRLDELRERIVAAGTQGIS